MRSFGFVLVLVGAMVAVLGWNGKAGAAFAALLGKGVQIPSPAEQNAAGQGAILGPVPSMLPGWFKGPLFAGK